MLNQKDILLTQDMIANRHLDIRTITMGISLLDCCDPDLDVCCAKIYKKTVMSYRKTLTNVLANPICISPFSTFHCLPL